MVSGGSFWLGFWLFIYVFMWGFFVLAGLCRLCFFSPRRRGTFLSTTLGDAWTFLTLIVLLAFWPICPVVAFFWVLFHTVHSACRALLKPLGALPCCRHLQPKERARISRRKNGKWHRRGWLVLLRARHQRTAAAHTSPRWRWPGCCSKLDGNGIFANAAPFPREGGDVEGGQGSVVHDTAVVSEFGQLVAKVVECEQECIFRRIVGYL